MEPGKENPERIQVGLRISLIVFSAACISFALIATRQPVLLALGLMSIGGTIGAMIRHVSYGTRGHSLLGALFGVVAILGLYLVIALITMLVGLLT